eukprot:463622_1
MGCICGVDDPEFADTHDRRIKNTETQPLISSSNGQQSQRTKSKSNEGGIKAQKKSTVANRLSIFEEANNTANKPKKNKTKTTNKPRKKWAVKGIDDKHTHKKVAINAQSNIPQTMDDDEPSVSMSHSDRMKLYEQDVLNVDQKQKERAQQHKESRGGYSGVEVSSAQKDMAKKLLQQRVIQQKKGDINRIMTLDNDSDIVVKSGKTGKKKKLTVNELLKNAAKEDSRDIVSGMGLIVEEFDTKMKRNICTLNMNNNNMMTRLTEEQKLKLVYLIGHSMVNSDNNKGIHRLTMCNAGIEDKTMVELMRVLVENKDGLVLNELWLESNKIGDDGMMSLCRLIECNVECLTVIKLYNNKKDVSTNVCNRMLGAMAKNDKIIKFTFEWRLQQQKDKLQKLLRKNQELKRKSRLSKSS